MSEEVRESLTGHWLSDKLVLTLFGLVFGVTFAPAVVPRFGPVDYRALAWVVASGGFYYVIGTLLFRHMGVLHL
jgi:hypothetical protein